MPAEPSAYLPVVQDRTVSISAALHPFSNRRQDAAVFAGGTILEILTALDLAELTDPAADVHLFVDDRKIDRLNWIWYIPHPGQTIAIRVVPGGGGSGKNVMRAVMMIAVTAFATWLAGPAGVWLNSEFLGYAVAMGAGIAGNLAVNALVPYVPLDDGGPRLGSAGLNPALTGTRNRANPFGPIPRLFGTHRLYPLLAAEPYTENRGADSWLRMLFCIGVGDYDISAMKIGETALTTYAPDYEVSTGYYDTLDDIYPFDVHQDSLSIEITNASGWNEQTTPADITEISLDMTFPDGIWVIYDSGNKSVSTIVIEAEYSVADAGVWTAFPGSPWTASGNWEKRWSGSFRVADLAADSYDVRVRRTTSDVQPGGVDAINNDCWWTAMRSFRYSTPFALDGVTLIALSIKASGILNGVIDQFNCVAAAKLPAWSGSAWSAPAATRSPAWAFAEVLRGAANANPVADAKINGADLLSWATACTAAGYYFDAVIDSKTTVFELLRKIAAVGRASFGIVDNQYTVVRDILQTTARQHFSPRNSWDFSGHKSFLDLPHGLRCRFVNAAAEYRTDEIVVTDDGYYYEPDTAETTWSASTAYALGAMTAPPTPNGYLYQCMTAGTSGGSQPGWPTTLRATVTDGGCVWMCETIASEFETMDFWGVTDADHIFKLARYHIAVARLRPETYQISTDIEWVVCVRGDLVRLTHDVLLVGLGQARIKSIAGSTVTMDAALPMGSTNKIVNGDMEIDANWSFQGASGGQSTERVHAGAYAWKVIATLGNQLLISDAYSTTTGDTYYGRLYIYPVDCTSVSVYAMRGGETVAAYSNTFDITPGQWNELTFEYTEVNGGSGALILFRTVTAGTFYVDDVTLTAVAGSYGAQIRKADGTMLTTTMAGAGSPNTVTLADAAGVAAGDMIFYGETGSESIDCIISRIEPGPDMSARLTLVPAAPDVHDADTAAIPDYDPGMTVPPVENREPPTPVIESITLAAHAIVTDNITTTELRAVINFSISTIDPESLLPTYCQGQYRTVDGGPVYSPWLYTNDAPITQRYIEVVVEDGRTYDFRVRAVSEFGVTSAWATESGYTVTYSPNLPNTIAGLALVGGGSTWPGRDVQLIWNAPTDLWRVVKYQLNIYDTDPLTLVRVKTIPVGMLTADYTFAENYEDHNGSPVGALTFRLWAVAADGTTSAAYDDLVVTHTAPMPVSGLSAQAFRGGVIFTWNENTDAAFSHFEVRVRVESDSWSAWFRQTAVTYQRTLTVTEIDAHDPDATIYIEVRAVDVFGTQTAASADDENAAALYVQPTDIDDFAVDASKLFWKIPVIEGLVLSNNSPSAGYVAWNAHSLFYDGSEYSIAAGNTDDYYIYWKDLAAATYSTSDDHPADNEATWDPAEDFIIAVNDEGSAQAAWNAIANQVVGSSYIMDAAIQDLHVDSISGGKIIAGTMMLTGLADEVQTQMAPAYNQIKNGEFKKDASGDWTPSDWVVTNTGSVVASNAYLPTGSDACPWDINNGMVFQAQCDSTSEDIMLQSEDFIPVNDNFDYCLSVWVRQYSGSGCMYLGLEYYDSSYSFLAPDWQYILAYDYDPASSWHQLGGPDSPSGLDGICYNSNSSETYALPAGTAYVKVRMRLQYQTVGGCYVSRIAFHEGLNPQQGITVLDGGHIYTGTVTANQIAANTITANEIAAGAITATEIEAGAITLTGLDGEVRNELGPTYNLVKNGEFTKDPEGTQTPTDWSVSISGTPLYRMTYNPYAFDPPWNANDAMCFYAYCDDAAEWAYIQTAGFIPVDENKEYCLSAWVYGYAPATPDSSRRFYLGLYYYDENQSAPFSAQYITANDYSPTYQTWEQVSGICYPSSSSETSRFPVGTKYVRVICYPQFQAVGGNFVSRICFNEGRMPQRGVTVIDGGSIYTNSITASQIKGDAFGELTITSGKIAINTSDALEIQAGGNMRLLSGGDIIMTPDDSSPSKIVFEDGGAGTYDLEIYRNATLDQLVFRPTVTGTCRISLGQSSYRLYDLHSYTSNQILLQSYSSYGTASLNLQTNTAPGTTLAFVDATGTSALFLDAGGGGGRLQGTYFRPYLANTHLGTSGACWGAVYSDTGVSSCSDRKYKINIGPTALGLDFIDALVPIQYEWNAGGKRPKNHTGIYHGLVASEVEQALIENGHDPEQFAGIEKTKDEDGEIWYGLQYEQMIAPLIRAVQELHAKIERLSKK